MAKTECLSRTDGKRDIDVDCPILGEKQVYCKKWECLHIQTCYCRGRLQGVRGKSEGFQ